jgi:nucleotide-binding universal stress UspA family protein
MKQILVPFDFSQNAETALLYAKGIAEKAGAGITVFHIVNIPSNVLAHADSDEAKEALIENEEANKLAELQEKIALLFSDVNHGIKLRAAFSQLIVEKTLELAQAIHADLIVMGTHGASGLSEFLFGSNTSTMISKSAVPVLAIPPGYKAAIPQHVVYASDAEHIPSEIQRISIFAKALQASVTLLHFTTKDTKTVEQKIAEQIPANTLDSLQITVRPFQIDESLLTQIRHYITTNATDWVVMVTKERGFWSKLLGASKTESLANELPVPLLSLKKQ